MSHTALLTYALERPIGGIGSYTTQLIEALRQAGAAPLLLKAGRSRRPGAIGLPGAGRLPGLLTLGQIQIARSVGKHHLQLVHDPTGVYPLYLARCRKVVTIHDALPFVYPQTSTALEKIIYRGWLPHALRQADAVITVSQHSRQDIMHCLPVRQERIYVIAIAPKPTYRPLPEDEIQPALARHGIDFPYILYVGSLEPRKNLPRLLQAYARLGNTCPAWHLVIVGARNPRRSSATTEAVQALEPRHPVHFTGFVPEADLPALYNGASLLCFPSLYEGFGLPPLEAMACGTPVVTSNCSSLPEVVGEAALLVDPCDVAQITAAMARILSDPALANELRQRGLARAAQFTWQRMAEETLHVYQELLDT